MKDVIFWKEEIDEAAARAFLNDCYKGIDLLPGVPETLQVKDAALVLGVSELTIQRMVSSGKISLSRKSIVNYIFANFLYRKPLEIDLYNVDDGTIKIEEESE